MTDYLSSNETQPCLPGQVVVNLGADQWVSWPNGNGHTGAMIGVCSKRCVPGNPISVVTVGRVPYDAYNLGAGNESSITAGNFPSRGTGGTVIGTADPAGEITVLPSYVGQGVPFSPTPGTAGQFFMTNAVPATAWVSLSGDAQAATAIAGSITVTGIQNKPFSNIAPSTNWVPVYNGSAWVPQALNASQLPNLAGDVIGNPNTTVVANINGVSGNTNLNANLVALRDAALSVGSNTARLLTASATIYTVYNAANDAQPATSVFAGTTKYGAGGAAAQDLRTYRSGTSEFTIDNGSGGNANLVTKGKTALQGASSDYTAYGNAPGASGFIRVTPNTTLIAANGNTVLKLDANSNATLNGGRELDLQVNGVTQVSLTGTQANIQPNGVLQAAVNSANASFLPPLGGLGAPLTYAVSNAINVTTSVNTTITLNSNQYQNPIVLLTGNIPGSNTVNIVFPQVRTLYLLDGANVNALSVNANLTLKTGAGTKAVTFSDVVLKPMWVYVDGANSVYTSNLT